MQPSGRVGAGGFLAVLAATAVLAPAHGNGAGVARVGLGLGFGLLKLDRADAWSWKKDNDEKDDSKDFNIPFVGDDDDWLGDDKDEKDDSKDLNIPFVGDNDSLDIDLGDDKASEDLGDILDEVEEAADGIEDIVDSEDGGNDSGEVGDVIGTVGDAAEGIEDIVDSGDGDNDLGEIFDEIEDAADGIEDIVDSGDGDNDSGKDGNNNGFGSSSSSSDEGTGGNDGADSGDGNTDSGDGGNPGTCPSTDGVVGIESSNGVACCLTSCGGCGGKGCSGRDGGGDGCCTSDIIENDELCSVTGEAPCLIVPQPDSPDGGDGTVDVPGVCPSTDGIYGIESSNGVACCLTSCGACGGKGCSDREGGGDGCCTSDIIENDNLCSETGVAPCLIVPQPESPDGGNDSPDMPGVCPSTDGVVGIESSNGVACCLTSCGACGGSGCSKLEGGGDGCCTANIIENDELCSVTGEAPCLIVPQPDDGDDSPDMPGVCPSTDGVVGIESSNGVACCLTSCGACGGSGCSKLEGGGDGCCTANIIENDELCSVTGEAPCLIVPQPDSPDDGDDSPDIHPGDGGDGGGCRRGGSSSSSDDGCGGSSSSDDRRYLR